MCWQFSMLVTYQQNDVLKPEVAIKPNEKQRPFKTQQIIKSQQNSNLKPSVQLQLFDLLITEEDSPETTQVSSHSCSVTKLLELPLQPPYSNSSQRAVLTLKKYLSLMALQGPGSAFMAHSSLNMMGCCPCAGNKQKSIQLLTKQKKLLKKATLTFRLSK